MLFCSLEQKVELEQLYERDKHLLNRKFRLRKAIYCDSGHPTYQARWNAALNLRDKAKHLQNRERESAWTNLMANFVFEDINHRASECVDHCSL